MGLGDLLTGLPALRALRAAHPDHRLVLAAPAGLRPLVELAGLDAELVDTRGLTRLPWHGEPPGLAVNLHGGGPQSHRLLAGLDPARLVAFGCPEAGYDGPAWRDDEHEVARWCRLLEEALDVPTDPGALDLRRPDGPPPRPRAVVIHPGAAFPARRWPVERFAAVARWASSAGHDVVVTGGADEVPLAHRLCHEAGLTGRSLLAGRTDLAQLAAQVATAPLVVSGDTGVAHLATAYRRPSVVLFGPTPPARWGPPEDPRHRVLWHGTGPGDPFGGAPDPALCRIGVDEVVSAAESLLAGFPASRRAEHPARPRSAPPPSPTPSPRVAPTRA